MTLAVTIFRWAWRAVCDGREEPRAGPFRQADPQPEFSALLPLTLFTRVWVNDVFLTDEFVYSLLKFNLDSQQFTILPCPDLWPSAMVRRSI
jgi:hypothetical protein